MKLTAPNDCDNSPKRRILLDFLVAWYRREWDQIDNALHTDFSFQLVEESRTISKEELKSYLHNENKIKHLTFDKILSHGKFGACKGKLEHSNGTTDFAYFMEFQSAGSNLISSMVLYSINQGQSV